MIENKTGRRQFLKVLSTGAAGALLTAGSRASAGPSETFRID
ncbi:MAG: twin-arginine translocation signal domain-containing protein [Acidobacteriota bacterium]|nr:twin-arginine translocation signal domain-containing protein [Acidobacteriota bacterium]